MIVGISIAENIVIVKIFHKRICNAKHIRYLMLSKYVIKQVRSCQKFYQGKK